MEKHKTKNQKKHHHEKEHKSNGQHNKQRRQYARRLPAQHTSVDPCDPLQENGYSEDKSACNNITEHAASMVPLQMFSTCHNKVSFLLL